MENLSKILNSNRQPLSGQLYKYTNVVKGYQYRYFSVDPEAGILNYYLCENSEESSTVNPRGQVDLNGAIVCPSDEDSRTFTINCANGDMLKLRASDARARQVWIDGLRAVVEGHTQGMSSLPPKEHLAAYDMLIACRKQIQETELCNAELCRMIESSPPPINYTDPDLLMLKALATANTSTLSQAFGLLQRYHENIEMY
ncbi:unnamed protein product [Diamesa tonsa]